MNRSMHHILREATRTEHESLDALFGSLDLADERDFARFLTAHLIGAEALDGIFRRFVSENLDCDPPAFPRMVRGDLEAMGDTPADLPRIAVPDDLDPAGITYVICGSRLGLAVMRKQDYWGKQAGAANRYMEDDSGLALWRSLTGWMSQRTLAADEMDRAVLAARHAFDVFRQAFALSGAAARR